ncbi:MAG: UDP-N-acetylmuramoyl-L-alanyl-D-glutamate--2,6-diaminopimelate ligase [Cytophagales bacterium]|nr:UDP-N-acetylmuramoyl-L-alanyl-D-glutamate--2,6-diaminopimelate ligase [Cytophagales bacterium]
MAVLKDILFGVNLRSIQGDRDREITGLALDSREVKKGYLFIAIKGLSTDGYLFVQKAISSGAAAVLCEVMPTGRDEDVTYIETENSSKALGICAANFYGRPSEKLKLVGITGTNGKTTIVTLLHDLFSNFGYISGLLSTVENRIGDATIETKYTTPDAIKINELMAQMVSVGCTHCFMEVSSHALIQDRIEGLVFTGGVFTNISHDHLDYHKTFDEYIAAKKMLFDNLPTEAFALVNQDDKQGRIMLQNTKADKRKFAIKSMADFKARIIHNTLQGLELDVDGTNVWFKLVGGFNAYNLLTVYAVAVLLNKEKIEILEALSSLKAAKGRFEQVPNSAEIIAILDYAHTPDALENVLKTISELRTKNELMVTVVGCGGNRDKDKRPKMAKIAAQYSNKLILTSDNPRDEEPRSILDDMLVGVPKDLEKNTIVIEDRREAIRTACNLATAKDIVLVAGKGHETYQEIKGVRQHFDDKEILTEMLN